MVWLIVLIVENVVLLLAWLVRLDMRQTRRRDEARDRLRDVLRRAGMVS